MIFDRVPPLAPELKIVDHRHDSNTGNNMDLFGRNLAAEVAIVAEIGNNHEGSCALAEEMIGRAAETGVDAVKFQTFQPEHYISRRDAERFARLERFRLSDDDYDRLKKVAESAGVHFFSTPFDLASARFLNGLCDVFKISSGDNVFYPLIEEVAGFSKPMVLSGGLATLDDLAAAKDRIEAVWERNGVSPGLVLLHCVSSYPVKPEEANLAAIETLRRTFDCPIGYSDHTAGTEAAVLSVAAGARLIEKHFTIDKNYSDFRDHQLSAEPDEMAELVERVRAAVVMMGSGVKVPQPGELPGLIDIRRSVVAARNLTSGEPLQIEDITWVRPGGHLPPGEEHKILGRTLSRDIAAGDPITPKMVK